MMQKRQDIQGLRCISIIMVLLYHYYPRIFPQGRLGVDMFFVISGFLIALMLSKNDKGLVTYFIQFYWRRVKRILPLCYLVFLLSYITMYLLGLETFISINKSFGVRALVFAANVKISNDDQYETQLSGATVLLTHYWSLSTEVQFYLLAPVIVHCVSCQKRKTFSFFFLAIISLLHYITSSEANSFNSPFARLWQFMAGFIAYFKCADQSPDDCTSLPTDANYDKVFPANSVPKVQKKDWKSLIPAHLVAYLFILVVCIIVFIPSTTFLWDTVLRVIVTIVTMVTLMTGGRKLLYHPPPTTQSITTAEANTALNPAKTSGCSSLPTEHSLSRPTSTTNGTFHASLTPSGASAKAALAYESDQKTSENKGYNLTQFMFLEHPWCVYMGDISFALYLVHWPILCFVKAYGIEDPCVRTWCIPIAFVLSIVLAVSLHETFEKRYLQWGTSCNIVVIIVLILGCAALVFLNFEKPKSLSNTDDHFAKAIELNYRINEREKDNHQKSKYAQPCTLEGFNKIDDQSSRLTLMTDGTGNLTILIIGNSYARNHGDLIYEGLIGLHNKVYTYFTNQCETLVTSAEWDAAFGCVRKPMKNAELLELLKPDLLFIVERGIIIKNNLTSEMLLEDKYMQEIISNLDRFQQFTKRIFILGPIQPLIIPAPVNAAVAILKKKQRLRDAPTLVVDDNVNQRIRHGKIPEVCRKCIVYEWEHVFYNSTGHFVPFNTDTDLLLFDNFLHLGAEGKRKMEPFYANLGKEMSWMWEKNSLLL